MKFRQFVVLAGLLPAALLVQAQAPAVLISGPAGNVTSLDVEAAVQQFSFNERLARLARPQEVRRIAEEVYLRRALAAQAEKAGTGNDPLTQAVLKVDRERVLSDAQIYEVGKAGWPSDEVLAKAAQERYQANPKQFERPVATIRTRQIMLPKGNSEAQEKEQLARAEALRKELAGGADFAELARRHSTDPSTASRGGDMGFFARNAYPELERVIDTLKAPGDLSEVFATPYGLHILKLEQVRAAGIPPFAEIRTQLIEQLREEADQKARVRTVDAVKADMKRTDAAIEALARRFATTKD
jgi:peptidyl-prolyl cis-trans isomerase C